MHVTASMGNRETSASTSTKGATSTRAASKRVAFGLGGVIAILLCVAIVVFGWASMSVVRAQTQEQGVVTVKRSVMDAAKLCFAVEGAYPSSLEYLEDNYGLTVNHDDYMIFYDSFAANLPPSVAVILK